MIALRSWLHSLSDPNPLLLKELRTIFRTPLFIRFMYISTALLSIIVLAGGATIATGPVTPAEAGRIVFQLFFSIALIVISLVAPTYAATTLTGEREGRTYESLILTGMSPWRIVRGKFIASMAAMGLVLVSFSPVVGIAFLFGGVSPFFVIFAFIGLFLVMAPAVATGVAISARVPKTRLAILIALLSFGSLSFFSFITMWSLGEAARAPWGLTMRGPFWFAEALTIRPFDPDTLGLLVALPLFVSGMFVWFMLAAAVAGVRPAAEDRSTPFKLWAIAAWLGSTVFVFFSVFLFDADDAGPFSVIIGGTTLFSAIFIATIFTNEPPLAPRQYEMRRRNFGPIRSALSVFGPGAAGTTRFAITMVVLFSFGHVVAASLARRIGFPTTESLRYDIALLITAGGHATIGVFVVTFGQWLRLVLRNNLAARLITAAALAMMMMLPFLAALGLDADSLDSMPEKIPLIIQVSPVFTDTLVFGILDDREWVSYAHLAIRPIMVTGLAALFFWGLIELRVYGVRRRVEAQYAARRQLAEAQAKKNAEAPVAMSIEEALARTSQPPSAPDADQ